jgi:hypothetical protein
MGPNGSRIEKRLVPQCSPSMKTPIFISNSHGEKKKKLAPAGDRTIPEDGHDGFVKSGWVYLLQLFLNFKISKLLASVYHNCNNSILHFRFLVLIFITA